MALQTIENVLHFVCRRLRSDSSLARQLNARVSSIHNPVTLTMRDLSLVQAIEQMEHLPLVKVVPDEQNRSPNGLVSVTHPFTATVTDKQINLCLQERGIVGAQTRQSVSLEMIGVSQQAWDALQRQRRLAEQGLERNGVPVGPFWDGQITIELASLQPCFCCVFNWVKRTERYFWMSWIPFLPAGMFATVYLADSFGPSSSSDSTESPQSEDAPVSMLVPLSCVVFLWLFCTGVCICRGCRTCRQCCCTCKAMSVCEHEPEDTLPCPLLHFCFSWPCVWVVGLLFSCVFLSLFLVDSKLGTYAALCAAVALLLLATCPPCCVAARERCMPGTHAA